MKLYVNVLALATVLAAGSVLAADTPSRQRVDMRDCNVENHRQPPYPGTNWNWTLAEHREHCVQHHREQGNDALADKLQQHHLRERR